MTIALVVATGLNNAIGKDNRLLWHLPDDLKFFKRITLGHPIVMGRSTFDSVGKALPGRRNVVITRQKELELPGCEVVHSPQEALERIKDSDTVMIVGGEDIYRLFLPHANRVYRTLVQVSPEADRFFPELPAGEWKLTEEEHHPADEKHRYPFSFQVWERGAYLSSTNLL